MDEYSTENVTFSYSEKLKGSFKNRICRGIFIYVPTVKATLLTSFLVYVPIIFFAVMPAFISPEFPHPVRWFFIFILLWILLIVFISPFYTRYQLLEDEKPAFFRLLLQKTNVGSTVGYCSGLFIQYYRQPHYFGEDSPSGLLVHFILPIAGGMLAITLILGTISYFHEKKSYKRKHHGMERTN